MLTPTTLSASSPHPPSSFITSHHISTHQPHLLSLSLSLSLSLFSHHSPSVSLSKFFSCATEFSVHLEDQMKQLIRRLSRVADSSQYCLLRSGTRSSSRPRRSASFRSVKPGLSGSRSGSVPEGHLPVYVGEEMERFVVSAELLNHPMFIQLLNKSAQEYGYEQKGVLRIPCHVLVFERVLEALRVGDESRDFQDLLNSMSDDFV